MEQGLSLLTFTDLLIQLPGLHWWQSLAGDKYAFSPACRKLTGSRPELSPERWQNALHPHDSRRRTEQLQLQQGEETSIEYRIATLSGHYQWVQENVRRIESADQGPVLISTAIVVKEPQDYAQSYNFLYGLNRCTGKGTGA